MIAVIFEVWPAEGRKDDYLNIAHELRSELDKIDGFISVERFESIYEPGKYLALSFFENEEAVQAWREHAEHRIAQAKGRGGIFANYRLRVAEVMRDYGPDDRVQAPNKRVISGMIEGRCWNWRRLPRKLSVCGVVADRFIGECHAMAGPIRGRHVSVDNFRSDLPQIVR